ncbi:ABC transporter substrate-binding protein [Nonomuraea sp. NPDC005650]|uniref:ABC transporter substrate-binding protein n=1 Tax=Nonomuraea sp. NPDC005650 TaxID=3157045 RepID=UPI0033B5FE9C
MKLSARAGARPVAVAVLLGLTAACGATAAAPKADGPITISFLSYNYGTPDLGGQGTQQLIDAFQRTHPNIRVKPQGVATKDVLVKLRTDTAAGSPPDVAQIGWSKMGEAMSSLPLVPVQDIPPAPDWSRHVAGISPAIMKAVAKGGKVWAMPYTMSVPMLYVNADLFRRAGLDPAKPPATVEDVKEAALKIRKAGAQGAYFDIANSGKSDFLTQSIIASNGGGLVGADGSVTLDQPPAVQALSAMRDLTASGAQPAVATEDAVAAFSAGKLGMLVTSTALLASLEKTATGTFELRTGAFPGFAGKPARPTYSGAGLAVLAKDAAHRQAAWEFIRFLSSEEGYTIITSKIGYLPLRESIVDDDRYLGPYFAKNQLLKPSLAKLGTVAPYTSFAGKRANEAVVMLQDQAVEPIVFRGADPATTLAAVAGKIRALPQQ